MNMMQSILCIRKYLNICHSVIGRYKMHLCILLQLCFLKQSKIQDQPYEHLHDSKRIALAKHGNVEKDQILSSSNYTLGIKLQFICCEIVIGQFYSIVLNVFRSCYLNKQSCKFWIYFGLVQFYSLCICSFGGRETTFFFLFERPPKMPMEKSP